MNSRKFRIAAIVTCAVLFAATIYFAITRPLDETRINSSALTHSPAIAVYFSPNGGCTDAIIAEVNTAKATLDIQAYSFTNAKIAHAVKSAHDRGVKVRIVLDKSQRTDKYSSATYFFNNQISVFIDDKHTIAHSKIMLIDNTTIITGSFNFTQAAENKNAENLLVIHADSQLFNSFYENFMEHLAHSTPYQGIIR